MFVIVTSIIKFINSAQIGIGYFKIVKNQFSHCSSGDFCSHERSLGYGLISLVDYFKCDPRISCHAGHAELQLSSERECFFT